jgi:hypothetical protein
LKPPASERPGTLLWIDLKQLSFAIVTTPIPLLLSKNLIEFIQAKAMLSAALLPGGVAVAWAADTGNGLKLV